MPKMLESNSSEMPQLTEGQLAQAVVGDLVVIWQGQRLPLKLRRDELRVYHDAQDAGYVVVRRRRVNLSFAFSTWCDLHNKPSIKLEVRRVYAAVQLHMITTSHRRLSNSEQEGIGRQFKRYMHQDSWFTLGELYAYCSKVQVDKAKVLARSLLLTLQRSKPTPVDLKSLDGDALERAIAVGYLVGKTDEHQLQVWRNWCHSNRRPTVTLNPIEAPGRPEQFTLELLPTQYANSRFQQFTVEDVRRILLNVSRISPKLLQKVLEGTSPRTEGDYRSSYLSYSGFSVGPLPLKTACRLASGALNSLGFLPGQEAITALPLVDDQSESVPLFSLE